MANEHDLDHYDRLPYRVDLTRNARDNVWVATYPELPGAKAHGDTQEAALAAAREMKTLWLKMALEKKRRIPDPEPESTCSGKFNVRIARGLHERAVSAARMNNVSLNAYVSEALTEKVERTGQEHQFARLASTLHGSSGTIAWKVDKLGTSQRPLDEKEAAQEPASLDATR